jgi:hypothetical protein
MKMHAMDITIIESHFTRAVKQVVAIIMAFLIICTANAQTKFRKTSSMFDGKTLNGWKVVNLKDTSLWSVEQGAITCHNHGELITANSFLQSEKEYQNFEFRCLFRLSGDSGFVNSGIQYRSYVKNNGDVVGYQADIGNGYWGDLYDEHRRGTLIKGDSSILPQLLNDAGWNSYVIRVKNNFHELYINGIKTLEYVETDRKIPSKGIIALQIHGGGIAKVEFKDIFITTY